MKNRLFSGIAFTVFGGASCVMSLLCLPQTLTHVEAASAQGLLHGAWTPQFEKNLGDALPAEAFSRDLWGRLEYAAFGQGRRGVVAGRDGWLFTAEEFSCPPHAGKNFDDNMDFVQTVARRFARDSIRLAVILVPEKARVYPDKLDRAALPPCRAGLYAAARDAFGRSNIPVTDLLPLMRASPLHENLYLRADTHWSPEGARLAAGAVRDLLWPLGLPAAHFSTKPSGLRSRAGDLARYLPGVNVPEDVFTGYATGTEVAGATDNLFGDDAPPVTLVGTSYSAIPAWNFDGFLKEALKTDILNAADEGKGPFVVMDGYLQDDSWRTAPPRLVLWEIPERFLLLPHGVSAD
jgi:alginate O-acetyltransferase complex protein AlgJ